MFMSSKLAAAKALCKDMARVSWGCKQYAPTKLGAEGAQMEKIQFFICLQALFHIWF